jgi:hypothetical protein
VAKRPSQNALDIDDAYINDGAMVVVIGKLPLLVETLIDGVLDLEHSFTGECHDAVAWLEVVEARDSLMLHI